MKRRVYLLFLPILITSCHSYTCKDIPNEFSSTDAAIQRIKTSTFRFTDEFTLSDTSKAFTEDVFSWIMSANYYSCDGEKGYLIYHVWRGSDYLRTDIPIELWKGLKDTSAKGPYYDRYIKGKKGEIIIISDVKIEAK